MKSACLPAVLEVQRLQVTFRSDDGDIPAVEDVSFSVQRGQTLCIVGESGSGKTVSALAAMGLHDKSQTRISAAVLALHGQDLLTLPDAKLRQLRGNRMAMIFQDPMTALNPYLTIGAQLAEVLILHKKMPRKQALDTSAQMLTDVGIPAAKERLAAYPHELSGGMRQRVVIAMAQLCQPDLLFADEPTTALDVTIQAQVLQLLKTIQKDRGTALVLITHDLSIVANMADQVLVMYGGMVMEQGDVTSLFRDPQHPYTVGLLGSLPSAQKRGERLFAIAGMPPLPQNRPKGCVFAPRCPLAVDRCAQERPPLLPVAPNSHHLARCFRAEDVPAFASAQRALRSESAALGTAHA